MVRASVGDCSIGYWGDSISALTAPRINPEFTVTLHAVVGGTALAAQATLLQDPLAERFQVLEYGMNDADAGEALQAPIASMLARVTAVGATPVLTGLSHATAGNEALRLDFDLWLSQQGAAWADWPDVAYAGASDLLPDGIHPDDAYSQRLADALSAKLALLAPDCVK